MAGTLGPLGMYNNPGNTGTNRLFNCHNWWWISSIGSILDKLSWLVTTGIPEYGRLWNPYIILSGVTLGGSWLISHKIRIFLPHTNLPTFLNMPRVREILIINPINTLYHVGIYWVYQYVHLQRAPTGGGKRSGTIPRGSWHDRTKATEIFQQLNKARTVRWTLAQK